MKDVAMRFGLAVALLTGLLATHADAEMIVGLTSQNSLVNFDSATPGTVGPQVAITGTSGNIVAIDRRPNGGALYGLDANNNLYTINAVSGVATFASRPATGPTSQLIGFDFNPVPDRLRITDSNGSNLRINVDTGATIVDTPLAYAASDANAGVRPSVVASAYTNSFAPSPRTTPGTTLYGIDSNLGILVLQNPPNAGTLNTVGRLGITVNGSVGFDISGLSGTAYLSSTAGQSTDLYRVNLSNGAATRIGSVGSGVLLRSIAAPLGIAAVPEPAGLVLLGTGAIALLGYRRSRRKTAGA